MKKNYITLFFVLSFASSWAQIGINSSIPHAGLAVGGDVKTNGSLFLENPGSEAVIRNSKLLIQTTSDEIVKYDIDDK